GLYPNPARDAVRIAIDAPERGAGTLSVYDVAGRLVSRETTALERGSNLFFLRSLPAASGVYFVHVSAPSGEARGRLLVIR
ncbi:MAG TPA: T9SS type A sorting domain-containing protein, partial [Candidatus Krumholzibacteria bacterium]|nr:T9SS type A sorting domain-containing protein [Candidatus Krumholzibacteria bacterium]